MKFPGKHVFIVVVSLACAQFTLANNDSLRLVQRFQQGLVKQNYQTLRANAFPPAIQAEILLLEQYLNSKESSKQTKFNAQCLLLLGLLQSRQHQFRKADSLIELARQQFVKLQIDDFIFLCDYTKAQMKIRQGVVDDNILVLQKAKSFFQSRNDTLEWMQSLSSLSFAFAQLGEPKKARDARLETIYLAKAINNCQQLADAYRALNSVYVQLKQYDSSRYYLSRSYEVMENCNTREKSDFLAMLLVSQAKIEKTVDSLTDTDSLLAKAQQVFYDGGNVYWYAYLFYVRSINHMEQQRHQMAYNLAKQGYDFCVDNNLVKERMDNLSALTEACEQLGDYRQAYQYYQEFNKIKEASVSTAAAKASTQVDFQLQAERDRFELELSHQKSLSRERNRKNMLLSGVVLILLIALGLFSRLRFVRKANKIIEREKQRSDELLLNILPAEIAEELKMTGQSEARNHEVVTILFTDFKEFTQISEKLSATELVNEIDACFKTFDSICEKYAIEKIKTIGDSYMAAGGLPVPKDMTARDTVLAGLEMMEFILKRKSQQTEKPFEMRVGIHTGPVVAGIVGVKKFQYDLWGDTVNTASRMENACEVGRVNISQATYEFVKDDPHFSFEHRGKVEAKGKGAVDMFFVHRSSAGA